MQSTIDLMIDYIMYHHYGTDELLTELNNLPYDLLVDCYLECITEEE